MESHPCELSCVNDPAYSLKMEASLPFVTINASRDFGTSLIRSVNFYQPIVNVIKKNKVTMIENNDAMITGKFPENN